MDVEQAKSKLGIISSLEFFCELGGRGCGARGAFVLAPAMILTYMYVLVSA